jgi:hypothetical protein
MAQRLIRSGVYFPLEPRPTSLCVQANRSLLRDPELHSLLALRERLYDLLARFPSAGAVTVLVRARELYPAMDGDPERPIGAALADAIEKCQGAGDEGISRSISTLFGIARTHREGEDQTFPNRGDSAST